MHLQMTQKKNKKKQFYSTLSQTMERNKKDDLVIGKDKTGYEQIMGRHGLGEMNENGEMLADFCFRLRMCHWGLCVPPQRNTQGNMGFSKQHH